MLLFQKWKTCAWTALTTQNLEIMFCKTCNYSYHLVIGPNSSYHLWWKSPEGDLRNCSFCWTLYGCLLFVREVSINPLQKHGTCVFLLLGFALLIDWVWEAFQLKARGMSKTGEKIIIVSLHLGWIVTISKNLNLKVQKLQPRKLNGKITLIVFYDMKGWRNSVRILKLCYFSAWTKHKSWNDKKFSKNALMKQSNEWLVK